MGWLIIIVIAYLPIVYRINKRLNYLENEVKRLNGDNDTFCVTGVLVKIVGLLWQLFFLIGLTQQFN